MTDKKTVGSVTYRRPTSDYFEKRGLQRYAGVWSLWALGVGAVISGHFSGWNFGFASGGLGGMLIAAHHDRHDVSGPRLLHRGDVARRCRIPAPPIRSRAARMGPWGGFVTGLARASNTS